MGGPRDRSLVEAYGRYLYGDHWRATPQERSQANLLLKELRARLRTSGWEIVPIAQSAEDDQDDDAERGAR